MHSTFNLLTSLLPSGLFALLVAGSPAYPTSLANVRQTFEEFNVPLVLSFLWLSGADRGAGVGMQIPQVLI